MDNKSNVNLFQSREELPETKDQSSDKHINLRTTDDISVLESVLHQLQQKGEGYVLASWISPPFGIIRGYGVYTREEAQVLSRRSQDEHWGFPRFGSIYDKERLERRIEKLREKMFPNTEPSYQP